MAFGLLASLNYGCAIVPPSGQPTATPRFATATLPPTPVPSATPVPPSPTPSPSATPLAGITSTQLYVRGQPSAAGAQLGLIGAAAPLQIVGRDSGGNWYQIIFPAGSGSTGWVSAKYVVAENPNAIPIVGAAGDQGLTATVVQELNVRSGPGTGFDSLGTLNPSDVVTLTGRDNSSTWLQIGYSAGPNGRGWVAAGYVEAPSLDGLPVIAEAGQVLATGTPTAIPVTPTPTALPAPDDGDSADSPGVSVRLSPTGTGALLYAGEVSSPEGDAADWISFTPYTPRVTLSLSCAGSGGISGILTLRGQIVPDWAGLTCDSSVTQSLSPDQPYLLRLSIGAKPAERFHVNYVISIRGEP